MLITTELRLVRAWLQTHREQMRQQPSDRGDGILIWVIMTALLAAAAIAIVTIIVTKATDKANNTQTQ
jgi:flagellar basal body-associated protein FliL